MRAKLRKVADSSFCYNREQERGMTMYFHKCMHVSILVPPITYIDAWWPRSRIAQLNMKWMHMKIQQNLTPSWIIRSVGDLGIETRSVTRSTERTSFPVPGLTPIPNTMQYAWHAWNATKIQPNMQNATKWHTRCTRWDGIHNALIYILAYTMLWNEMAYTMQYGLTLTQVDLSHTHIRGHKMKVKCLEMRAYGHANWGNGIKAWNGMANDMQTC